MMMLFKEIFELVIRQAGILDNSLKGISGLRRLWRGIVTLSFQFDIPWRAFRKEKGDRPL